ncbi:hypothetical protein GCM10020258_21330 [Sphingomonas yabuuchiae]
MRVRQARLDRDALADPLDERGLRAGVAAAILRHELRIGLCPCALSDAEMERVVWAAAGAATSASMAAAVAKRIGDGLPVRAFQSA